MSKRPYHHGDLRAAMLEAAETILRRDGPDALTLRAAAREAGVSHAAPVHHFGDLAGLLSLLAASGFERFRAHLVSALDAAGDAPRARLLALCDAYVAFAAANRGLFELMFRSARLDWSVDALRVAAGAAFALLMRDTGDADEPSPPFALQPLALAMSRWSMAHGAAMLAIDGRLDAFAAQSGHDPAVLIAAMLRHVPGGIS